MILTLHLKNFKYKFKYVVFRYTIWNVFIKTKQNYQSIGQKQNNFKQQNQKMKSAFKRCPTV